MKMIHRLLALFRRAKLDREMDAEMRAHLTRETEANVARGMAPDNARRAARRAFGGIDRIQETERDARGFRWLENTARDVRHAMRSLRKSPGFTSMAVLSLALGLGANTAIFSLMNAILLRSLPVPNAHELRILNWTGGDVSLSSFEGSGWTEAGKLRADAFAYPTYRDFQKRAEAMAEVFCFFPLFGQTTEVDGNSATSGAMLVSGNFFSGYGAEAFAGRVLTPEDDRPDAPPAAVITYRFWQRRFGSDPGVLGRTVDINRHPFAIVGVLPVDYTAPLMGNPIDVYVPMAAQPQLKPTRPLGSYDHWWVLVMARLAPGTTDTQLHAALSASFENTFEQSRTRADEPDVLLFDGRSGIVPSRRQIAPALYALQGIAATILVIACANLAGLLLARAAARRREFAVRAAIGAGRGQLIRRSLIDSLLLAVLGAGVGLLITPWISGYLMTFLPNLEYEIRLDPHMDHNVWIFVGIVTLMTALLCGLLPALRASRIDLVTDLQSGRTGGRARQRLGRVLVVAQVALSLLLVTGAGLFTRSLNKLRSVDPGFQPDHLLLFTLNADQQGLSERQRLEFFSRVRETLALTPGVSGVTAMDHRLLGGGMSSNGFSIPGRERRPGEHMQAYRLVVGEDFFATMQIPLLSGRTFGKQDTAASEPVTIINKLFAERHFPDVQPIGRHISIGRIEYRIVGVCGSALYRDVKDGVPVTHYLPSSQHIPRTMTFAVRSDLSLAALVPAARKAVASCDPSIPMANISTQREQLEGSLALDRTFAALCKALGGLAILLCCIGLYGLLTYRIAQQKVEIGIRMALGALPWDVARNVVTESLLLTAWGLLLGLPLAMGLSYLGRAAFFYVTPYDPISITAAVLALTAAIILAAWLPARRAANVDPMLALRAE